MSHDIEFFPEEHIYLVDGVETPSVTTILSYLTDTEYREINPAVLEQAAKRGTFVHEACEILDYGADPEEVPYEWAGYIKAYKDFLRDYKPDWMGIEKPVAYVSVYNGWYVGTLDRIGKIDGKTAIVDIKTLSSPTKISKFAVCSQTVAYSLAVWHSEGIDVQERYALYLGKDGDYTLLKCREYEEKYNYPALQVFWECKEMYERINQLKQIKPIKKGKKNEKV